MDRKGIVLYILNTWLFSALVNIPRISFTESSMENSESYGEVATCSDAWPGQIYQNVYMHIVDIFLFYVFPIILFAVFYTLIVCKVCIIKLLSILPFTT